MPKSGQYWSIENSKGRFCGGLRYLYWFYVLSVEKKKTSFVPAKGTFHGEISILRPKHFSFALQSMHLTIVFLASSKAE